MTQPRALSFRRSCILPAQPARIHTQDTEMSNRNTGQSTPLSSFSLKSAQEHTMFVRPALSPCDWRNVTFFKAVCSTSHCQTIKRRLPGCCGKTTNDKKRKLEPLKCALALSIACLSGMSAGANTTFERGSSFFEDHQTCRNACMPAACTFVLSRLFLSFCRQSNK